MFTFWKIENRDADLNGRKENSVSVIEEWLGEQATISDIKVDLYLRCDNWYLERYKNGTELWISASYLTSQ